MNIIKNSRCMAYRHMAWSARPVHRLLFRTVSARQNCVQILNKLMSTLAGLSFEPLSGGSRASKRALSTRTEHQEAASTPETHTHSHNGVPCGNSHSHSPPSPQQTADHGHSHSHGGHGDDHGHSHGLFHTHSHGHNELLTSGSLSNPAVRITWIGLFVNIGMAASKGLGGVYFHSQALIADAIHSVSDMVADFLTLATVNVSSKVGTPTRFPLGYGKIETVGSVLVLGILLFSGLTVGWSSLLQIFEYTLPAYLYEYVSMVQIGHSHSHVLDLLLDDHLGHSHSHGGGEAAVHTKQVPNINAAWLAGGSIIIKEVLYRRTMAIAEQVNSNVLVANAWHHRVDSLTAFVALLTVAGGHVFNVAWLDSVGGLCVSMLIIKAGWSSFATSFKELIDRGVPKESEVYATIESAVQDEISIVLDPFSVDRPMSLQLKKLSVIQSGANTNIYLTIGTSSKDLRIADLNNFEARLVQAIKREDKFVKNVFVMFKSPGAH